MFVTINGKKMDLGKVPGARTNSRDPLLKDYFDNKGEIIFTNGIVVHAVDEMLRRIQNYFAIEGIRPVRPEKV